MLHWGVCNTPGRWGLRVQILAHLWKLPLRLTYLIGLLGKWNRDKGNMYTAVSALEGRKTFLCGGMKWLLGNVVGRVDWIWETVNASLRWGGHPCLETGGDAHTPKGNYSSPRSITNVSSLSKLTEWLVFDWTTLRISRWSILFVFLPVSFQASLWGWKSLKHLVVWFLMALLDLRFPRN